MELFLAQRCHLAQKKQAHPFTVRAFLCCALLIFIFSCFLAQRQEAFAAVPLKALQFEPPPVNIDPALLVKDEEQTANDSASPDEKQTASSPQSTANSPATTGSPSTAGAPATAKVPRLFGSVEFRSALGGMPKWQRVMGAEKANPSFGKNESVTLTPAVAAKWSKVKETLQDASLQDKVKAVNSFFNQWPYKTDMVAWGVEDYWATTQEFVKKSGDCEDYAIAKYYALRSLGVPAEKMRVVAVIEKIRGIGHAVLVVYMNDNAYVLDNLTNLILPHTQLRNYEPKFSVNEEFRWAHVKPVSQPKKK